MLWITFGLSDSHVGWNFSRGHSISTGPGLGNEPFGEPLIKETTRWLEVFQGSDSISQPPPPRRPLAPVDRQRRDSEFRCSQVEPQIVPQLFKTVVVKQARPKCDAKPQNGFRGSRGAGWGLGGGWVGGRGDSILKVDKFRGRGCLPTKITVAKVRGRTSSPTVRFDDPRVTIRGVLEERTPLKRDPLNEVNDIRAVWPLSPSKNASACIAGSEHHRRPDPAK